MKIWVLLSIDNDYDQPDNNLVCFWEHMPSASDLKTAIDFPLPNTTLTQLLKRKEKRIEGTDYRLRCAYSGIKLKGRCHE